MGIEEAIKQTTFRNIHQKAVLNLLFTSNWLAHKLQTFFKPFGITTQQFNIMRILRGQHPSAISSKEIKARMLDRNSDVSRLLDRLAAKDLIIRRVCPDDKRAANIHITKKGLELLDKIDGLISETDNIISLSAEEAAKLNTLLDKSRYERSISERRNPTSSRI